MNAFKLLCLGALIFLVFPVSAFGQSFHGGVKLGVPITQYFDTGMIGSVHGITEYSAATRRYTFGASAEWRLNDAIGFEVDALYHRMGYVGIVHFFAGNGPFQDTAIDVKGNSWDFPLMAKYRMGHVIRPYIEGGGVVRLIGPVRGRGQQTTGSVVGTSSTIPIDTTEPSDLRKRFYPGITAGGGVEFGAGRIQVLPEFRYTYWTANISGPNGALRFTPNQVEFIVGVLF